MITQDGAEVVTGGEASLPATPAAALLDAAHPNELVVLDAAGAGDTVTLAGITPSLIAESLAARRTAATATTAMLWECTEAASPLASTGSVACNLADAGAATFDFVDPLPSLDGNCVHFSGTAASQVVGGAGVYPGSGTTTAVTMWAVVNIHTMPTGLVSSMTVCRDYNLTGSPWVPPYGCAVMIRAGGVVTGGGSFGGSPTYDEVSSASGTVFINQQHLVGMTYNGSNLRVWVDGVQVANKAVSSPLTWGMNGSWHLGGSGNAAGDPLSGVVIRAGVENAVWTRADWSLAYRRLTGNTSNL
jgi:hypothetical protein